ncbi:MAG TPA: ABC transporter ATP-binding protein [Gammaproteobacteria bacterium]|nr:ABC transporter ATP-binding protein [Gammaproteobacteria bacterium]
MNEPLIEVHRVTKRYGEVLAVEEASLSIRKGEIFSLIGHNGAGKSTLFKMMLGLLQPDSGEIRIQGEAITGERFRQVRRGIGYLPENVVFYDHLSGRETMRFLGALKGADPGTIMPLLKKVGLEEAASRPVRGYSKGMRQRLGFAQALLGEPRILFLDEPTTGLDPAGIREFYLFLKELREQGVTMVLSSHNLAQIQEQVDRIALMKTGKILTAGSVHELREQLNLPILIQVSLEKPDMESLRDALARFPECGLTPDHGSATIRCDRRQKMPLLTALSELQGIRDITIQEPSLEDLFLGYVESPEISGKREAKVV